tara:strand:+ start:18093 stop:20726 length:2634 start_codon:yes stop_codon:yes gene_type:complete
MDLSGIFYLIEQEGSDGLRKQIQQLDTDISNANKTLRTTKGDVNTEIVNLEKQLVSIYRQIEDAKLKQYEDEVIKQYEKQISDIEAELKVAKEKQPGSLLDLPTLSSEINEQVIDPNKELKSQVKQLRDQISDAKKQEIDAREQGKLNKIVQSKQSELEKINKEVEDVSSSKSKSSETISKSLETRLSNAQKALTNVTSSDGLSEQEQQPKTPMTPEQEREKEKLDKQIVSLNNELVGINKRINKYQESSSNVNEEEKFRVYYSNDKVLQEKFESKAQQRYFYAMSKKKGKEGKKFKKMANEFSKDTDFGELPEKVKKKDIKKRVKEIQVWGVNSNPGFGLGDVPRDKMYADVPGPAHNNVMGLSEMDKNTITKKELIRFLSESELTTRGGANGKIYGKQDFIKTSGPFSEKVKSLEEVREIIRRLAEINQINEMPINYGDQPERMHPSIEDKLSRQDTAFGKDHPAFPETGEDEVENNYQELLASKRFKDVVEKFKHYTGIQGNATDPNNMSQLGGMMMQSLRKMLQIESSNKSTLEQLAIKIVTEDLNLPEGVLQFDVELTGMQQLSKDGMRKKKPKDKEEEVEQEEETMEELEDLDIEVAKRRFINSMMQGSSKKALYLYHLVSDELESVSPDLLNLYGVVMSSNDLMYWLMPDMMGGGGDGEEAPVFGKESVDLSTTPPTIRVKGMTFPVLTHELHKGIMEYMSLHGLPGDKGMREKVMDKADFLEDEMWDLRLGPGIWERFLDSIGENDFEIKNHLYSEVIQMPASEFLSFMKEIQSGSDKGKQMMVDLANRIKDEIKQDEYDEVSGGEFNDYEEEEGDVMSTGPEDDIEVSDIFPSSTEEIGYDVDTLLDKIHKDGMDSLSKEESDFLKNL